MERAIKFGSNGFIYKFMLLFYVFQMVVFADLARMGLCLLDGGKFRGKQVIPAGGVHGCPYE